MIEQAVLGFLANAAWQIPLLAAGAAILLRLVRPAPAWQCRIWSAFLLLALLLPANIPSALPSHGQSRDEIVRARQPAAPVPGPVAPTPHTAPRRDPLPDSDASGLVFEPVAANLLTGLYLLFIGLGVGRLLLKLARARRLKLGSRAAVLPARLEAIVHGFAARHQMKPPAIRVSALLSGPAMVGLGKPVILLPEDFVLYAEAEAATALLHECAHVVRRDYGFSILCDLLSLPLIWHPAIHLIRAGISDSREMACDRLAAEQMDDRTGYARSLIALARKAVGGKPHYAAAQALLGRASLEKRVEAVMRAGGSRRPAFARDFLSFAILLPATLVPAILLHFTPSIAAAGPAASLSEQKSTLLPEPEPQIAAAAGMGAGQAKPGIAFASVSAPPPRSAKPPIPVPPAPTVPAAESADIAGIAAGASAARAVENAAPPAGIRRATAFQRYSDAERQQLHYNGIGAAEIAAFARAGYANLAVGDLVNLHYRGISARFVGTLGAAGFPPFSPAELIALSVQGVGASEIASLGRVGRSTLSAADLIRLHHLGVTPLFADRLHSLGYDDMSAAALIRMFQTGMFPRRPGGGRHG